MCKYKTVLAFDPSGSYNEGKGTTGWSFFKGDNPVPIACGQLRAEDHKSLFDYWNTHIQLICTMTPEVVVCEDYLLYADKADSQTNSRMETPKLIAIMEWNCCLINIPMILQRAVDVKKRWNEELLVHKEIISRSPAGRYYACGVQVSDHVRDSIKHGVHFITFKNK